MADLTHAQPLSLNEEFFTVWNSYNACMENISSTDQQLKLCIESCYMLRKRVSSASLFSSNEDIDDVGTDVLKFGLVSHFLCELYTNRNQGKRTLSLRYSDEFGKMFVHQCDNWAVLSKPHREILERGFGGTDHDAPKLNAFQARNEEVQNFKLQKQLQQTIAALLAKASRHQQQNADTKWRMFDEDEDERTFWLQQYQIGIIKTLKTLKQNAFERPLSEKWEQENEAQTKRSQYQQASSCNLVNQADEHKQQTDSSNPRAQHFQWQSSSSSAAATADKKEGPKIWSIDADGKSSAFHSVQEMKYNLEKNIDEKVKLRTDRKTVFRDPNPWTYTPEQAAQLGLLSEVPKDYFEQRKHKKRQQVLNQRHLERFGTPLGYNVDHDDGSELNPGQVEYHQKGDVNTFTMQDMPNDPTQDKEVEDMSKQEYEQWIQEERAWADWKDDHEKGAGNPYYR